MSTTTPSTSLVACLESYLSPAIPIGASISSDTSSPALHILPNSTLSKLRNLGSARAKDMRRLGHSKQILSHIPVSASLATCVKFNDAMFAATQLDAEKFAALALLPRDGREASRELQRCITKMKFVGGVIGLKRDEGSAGLLDDGYEEVWVMAEKYRVPIVLREKWPTGDELVVYQGPLAAAIRASVAAGLHTSHLHSPLPILHLYLSGVFDRHPNLRLVLSHHGLLPSLLPRIEALLVNIPTAEKPDRSFLDVWQYNFYLTTADVLDISTMRAVLEQIPIDRVLYASNYPLEERGKELMEELRASGFLTAAEWERVAWGNAGLLFGLQNNPRKPL
ncbi:hypothetical protein GQ44DRAFT_611404 [Phaeosphaeriaceae sp. PMI808]|nr:hypothetical protein GQ44DRAFT_611404 [Phaeosphaeriaceae sp. PMI808]